MKCNWTSYSLGIICLFLWSFQAKDASYLSFEKLLTGTLQAGLTSDTAYYIVVEPRMCASCNTQALRVLSAYTRNKPLYVFCDSSKQKELAGYISNKKTKYITRFDYKWVSKQIFMRSGLAFALGNHNQLQYVEVINGSNLKKYR